MFQKDIQNTLIINKPEALNPNRRRAELGIIYLGWISWLFVLRPLSIVILWSLGFKFFFHHMVYLKGLYGLLDKSSLYLCIIIYIFLLIRGWSIYNFSRFGRKNRRAKVKPVSEKELMEFFKFSPNSIKDLVNWNDVTVDTSPDFKLKFSHSFKTQKNSITGQFTPS